MLLLLYQIMSSIPSRNSHVCCDFAKNEQHGRVGLVGRTAEGLPLLVRGRVYCWSLREEQEAGGLQAKQ